MSPSPKDEAFFDLDKEPHPTKSKARRGKRNLANRAAKQHDGIVKKVAESKDATCKSFPQGTPAEILKAHYLPVGT